MQFALVVSEPHTNAMEPGSKVRVKNAVAIISYLMVLIKVSKSVSAEPQVNLTSGLWIGSELDVPGVNQTKIEMFLGVRYATPPLGKLRYQHPLPSEHLGEQSAKKMGPPCIQSEYFLMRRNMTFTFKPSSEDCLHMNIYRPKEAKNLPIIVHFFGGSFYGGYNGMFLYDPEQLVAKHNVIMVTVNFRVGLFGYLYLNSTEAPGNAGLYDMVLAANFVKKNAKNIGGDPERLTGWGQSAGAISLGMLMTSPQFKGLFKRVIFQSGSGASAASSLGMNSLSNGVLVASTMGCYDNSRPTETQLDDLARCLKTQDATELFETLLMSPGEPVTIQFQPMSGINDILPEFPFPADQTKIKTDPYLESVLMTTVENEGAMFIVAATERYDYGMDSEHSAIEVAWTAMRAVLQLPLRLVRAAVNAYSTEYQTLENVRTSMSSLFGDLFFECPADLHSEFLDAANVSVYRLLWAHRPSSSYWPDWVGATHFDDVPYTTGSYLNLASKAEQTGQASEQMIEYFKKPLTVRDRELVEQSLKMIGDFVKTGVPSAPSEVGTWPRYSRTDRATVKLSTEGSEIFHGPKSERCDVWQAFLTNSLSTPVYHVEPTVTEGVSEDDIASKQLETNVPKRKKKPHTSLRDARGSAMKGFLASFIYVALCSIFMLVRHNTY